MCIRDRYRSECLKLISCNSRTAAPLVKQIIYLESAENSKEGFLIFFFFFFLFIFRQYLKKIFFPHLGARADGGQRGDEVPPRRPPGGRETPTPAIFTVYPMVWY